MNKQFTAREVCSVEKRFRYETGGSRIADMLHAYADLLEAREKAVPFTWVLEFNDPDPQVDFSEGSECPKGWQDKAFPLYTHPAPADTERLAEALARISLIERNRSTSDTNKVDAIGRIAREALAAHSAQAQSPAASVPDIDTMVTRFLGWRLPQDFAPDAGISFKPMPDIYMPHCWPTGTNLFHAGQAKEMILHMLAAQENPNGV